MKFGAVPLDQAEGAILAHSVNLPGLALRKGLHLGGTEIGAMGQAGLTEVTVARLGPADLHEDVAAERIAAAVLTDPAAQGLRAGQAGTGRVNLYATGPGILAVDVAAIVAMNRINPMITLACLPPWARLAEGTMVATIKIISYGVPEADASRACQIVGPALRRQPPRYRTATLIETALTDGSGLVEPGVKGRNALGLRLGRLGLRLGPRRIVPHQASEVAEAIAAAEGEVIFILTISATSDKADTGPSAVGMAGGQMRQFGIPVDPGNLLFLGQVGPKPVIGLPGCARSPVLNGADWVLERVICGGPVDSGDLAAMGVGGLLKETPARGKLRDGAGT